MLKSSKFWYPFLVSFLVTLFLIFFLLASMGMHSKSSPFQQGLAPLFFPYATVLASFDSLVAASSTRENNNGYIFLTLLIVSFLSQIPIYGGLIGYANFKGKLKRMVF